MAWGHKVIVVALATAFLGTISKSAPSLAINAWSLEATRRMLQADEQVSGLSPAPPDHQREALWRGRLALAKGDVDAALGWFQRQAEATPGDPLTVAAVGETLVAQGKFAQGIAHLKEARAFGLLREAYWDARTKQRWDDVLLALQAMYELKPLDALVVSGLASALYQAKHDVDGAKTLLRQSIATSSDAETIVLWKLDLARICEFEDRWLESIAIYEEILASRPSDSRVHARLGWAIYQTTGSVTAALQELELSITLAPENSEAYLLLGRVYSEEGRFMEAIAMHRRAVELAPSSGMPLAALGDTALASGDVALAIEVLSDAAAKFPYEDYIHSRLATAYQASGDTSSAVSAIEHALAINQSNPRYWVLAGRLYEEIQEPDKALQAYQAVLALDPGNEAIQSDLERLRTAPRSGCTSEL